MTVHKETRTYTGSRLRETHYLVRCQQWPRRLLLTRHHVHLMTRPSCSWRGIPRSTPGRSGTTRIWSSEPDPSRWHRKNPIASSTTGHTGLPAPFRGCCRPFPPGEGSDIFDPGGPARRRGDRGDRGVMSPGSRPGIGAVSTKSACSTSRYDAASCWARSSEEPADACSPRDLRLPPTPDWGRSPPFFWDSKFPSPGVAARSCAWSICTSVTRLLPPGAPDAAKGAKLANTEHVERATWNEVGPGCPARSAKSGQADLNRFLVID
jgi:hypothetical protein